MANNASFSLGPIAPGVRLNGAVVNAGTVEHNPPLTKLFFTAAATITAVMAQSGTITASFPASAFLDDVAIVQLTTITTSGSVVAWW